MNIGISTATFYPEETDDIIDKIGDLGFKHIEIFVNTESEYERGYAQKLKEKIEYYGIEVVSVHPYTSLLEGIYFFSDYTKRTNDAYKIYEKYFEYARFMGAKYFTFHGERTFLASFDDKKITRDIETYNNLANLANSKGIFLAQENVVGHYSEKIEFLENLYKKVPNIRFTLDIKQARRAKKDPFSYLDIMGDKLCNIHTNDFTKESDCVLPGMGIFNYEKFKNELEKRNYNGDLLIEVYRTCFDLPEDILRSKTFLNKLLIK